ncbi:hypothetical protein D6D01_06748 [Aureobasidium pullulans]|uniref:BTB domain-containing protein n=1 Tax=Aureobasidium pullulans TaxID=5580 RepID=A0A4S9KWI8_AURPU|nr:hypothetical protein D6D01_06748 [Aureobasidium pullulans]
MSTFKGSITGNYYNNEKLSDITICFGEVKIHAHKVILSSDSRGFSAAFESQLSIATSSSHQVSGYSDVVVYAMLRHIYGFPLDEECDEIAGEEQFDYLFEIFLIANEYQIPSLAEAATALIVDPMFECKLDLSTGQFRSLWVKDMFKKIIARTAELYIQHNDADKSLLDKVIKVSLEMMGSIEE